MVKSYKWEHVFLIVNMDFSCDRVSDYISTFENITKNPEEFLEVQKNDCDIAKRLVKNIYDLVKSSENNKNAGNALPELIIENFDEEQIWQEIELQNNDILNELSSSVTRLCEKKDELIFPIRLKKKNVDVENETPQVNKLSMEVDVGDAEEEDNDSEKDSNEDINGEIETESDSELLDSPALNGRSKKEKKSKPKPSIVDDEFFKLSEMEEFLLSEEKENNETDFGIDLFEDIPSSDDEDEEEKEGGDKVRYRYKDFFAQPSTDGGNLRNRKSKTKMNVRDGNKYDSDKEEDGDDKEEFSDSDVDADVNEKEGDDDLEEEEEDGDSHNSNNSKAGKQVRFTLSDEDEKESDGGDESDDGKSKNLFSDQSDSEDDENEKIKHNEGKSSLEKRKERLSKHIQKLEEQALSEKPWQMKGEISATSRPQNSLLEEVLEFDMTSRPAPVMTEQTTERLEDIIIRRIKDKAWDDVERKLKPIETVNEFKKRLVLDQEKSKLSLAQIYEQEYIKQRDSATAVGLKAEEKEPEELREHKEIKTMMVSLFAKLNALANFHYTPKPAAPDIKIVSNLPAVTMEEVAPIAASDATLLAPEEVLGKKKKELIGKEERTKTDKKRERRKKKHWQKTKRKIQEAKETTDEHKSKKYTVEKAAKDLKKLANNRGVQIESTKNKKTIKTSTAFFSILQEEVKSKVHGQLKEKKKEKNVISAKRLKL